MTTSNNSENHHFESDPFPGKPRILFVGLSENSHTHSWIDLLHDAPFNVRLFSMPSGVPPDDWSVRTYVTHYNAPPLNNKTRARLYPSNSLARTTKRLTAQALGMPDLSALAGRWLARVIKQWRPHVIHTLSIDHGGEFYFDVRQKFGLKGLGKWILTTRGGSDLTLPHLNPARRTQLMDILASCDQIICDNQVDLNIARQLGASEEQIADIAPVPGTGGIDVDTLSRNWKGASSKRRVIVCTKAYDAPWVKILPAFEALKICWDRIQPCEIHFLSMSPESQMWFWSLPEDIRRSCHASERISRAEVLELMTRARVMLAPALTDGVPNSMYEAMAAGAFPIVSPLESIANVVKAEQNVLFARNLYPNEIAEALTRAMTDDGFVDSTAERNLELVRRIADRNQIRRRVVDYYERRSRDA